MDGWACGFICLYFVLLFFVGGPVACFILFFYFFVGGPAAFCSPFSDLMFVCTLSLSFVMNMNMMMMMMMMMMMKLKLVIIMIMIILMRMMMMMMRRRTLREGSLEEKAAVTNVRTGGAHCLTLITGVPSSSFLSEVWSPF